jgi:hypothetical protein
MAAPDDFVIVATGLRIQLGLDRQLSQSAPTARSPLQIRDLNIAKYVGFGVGALSIVVPVITVPDRSSDQGGDAVRRRIRVP